MRAFTCVLLATLPLAPTFAIAGVLYLLRLMLFVMTVPVRQSYVMGIVPPDERSRAAAYSNVPARITQVIGAGIAGSLIEHGWLSVPLELAALFQMTNAALFWRFFSKVVPPEAVSLSAVDSEPDGAPFSDTDSSKLQPAGVHKSLE